MSLHSGHRAATAGDNLMKSNRLVLANAGITAIAGVWTDDEDYPVHWADMKASVKAQRSSAAPWITNRLRTSVVLT